MIAFLFLAIAADGEFRPEEQDELDALALRTHTLHQLSQDAFDKTVLEVAEIYNLEGPAALFKKAMNQFNGSDGLAEAVYCHCADLLLVDRAFDTSERRFLKKLGNGFGLPAKTQSQMLEILILKNSA